MSIADMPREFFKSRPKKNTTQSAQPSSSDTSGKPSNSAQDVSAEKSGDTLSNLSESSKSSTGDSDQVSSMSGVTAAQTNSSLTPTQSQASGSQTQTTSSQKDSSPAGVDINAAISAGKGVGDIVTTGVKSPMNFCLGLAKGFRNVPRLYNDDTVRPVEKVTDLSSGIKIASREFGYGLFDGITGLVTQPLRGAEKDGAGGLVKGFGKGIGGLLTKPAAGGFCHASSSTFQS